MLIAKLNRQAVNSVSRLKELVDGASFKDGVLLQVQFPTGGTSYFVIKTN